MRLQALDEDTGGGWGMGGEVVLVSWHFLRDKHGCSTLNPKPSRCSTGAHEEVFQLACCCTGVDGHGSSAHRVRPDQAAGALGSGEETLTGGRAAAPLPVE